jgi:methyl-accepting chemotaxis protein
MRILKNLKVRTKIISVMATVIGLFVLTVVYVLTSVSAMDDSISLMYEVNLLSMDYLIEADRDLYQSSIAISHLLNRQNAEEEKDELTASVSDNLRQVGERFSKAEALYVKTGRPRTPDFEVFHGNYKSLATITDNILKLLASARDVEALSLYFSTYKSHFDLVRGAIDNLTGVFLDGAETKFEENKATSNRIFSISLTIISICIVFAVLFSILLTRSVTVPISDTSNIA